MRKTDKLHVLDVPGLPAEIVETWLGGLMTIYTMYNHCDPSEEWLTHI
jgi:hypothetical protein